MKYSILSLAIFFTGILKAQNPTQTVRGNVSEIGSQIALDSVEITCNIGDKHLRTFSDSSGYFRLVNVPVGRQNFTISKLGYVEKVLNNLDVSAGKELVLNILLEEKYETISGATISAKKTPKEKPINDMTSVSARQFSVEETQRYAAAVNDPARMAMGFAGVMAPDDGNNLIVIRGNAPSGLIWRMEGMDIPNPNHFSNVGTSGGGITILSAQLLSNSDFITGAFPAEYGNGLSGVFDLRLRKGNNEKREHTIQMGLLGLDLATEGSIGKKGGSYLVNYRYSTLSMIGKIINLGDAVTNFQDLSYHINLPINPKTKLSFFGFTGLSDQKSKAVLDTNEWKLNRDRAYSWTFKANSIFNGAKLDWQATKKHNIQVKAGLGITQNGYDAQEFNETYKSRPVYHEKYNQNKGTLSIQSQYKLNRKHYFRSGVIVNQQQFDFGKDYENEQKVLTNFLKADGQATVVQAYSQWQYRPSPKLTFNTGLHYLALSLNPTSAKSRSNSYSVEPRAGLKYQTGKKNWVSAGFGIHGQVLPLGNYFFTSPLGDLPNYKLKLAKAKHYVVGFDQLMGKSWHVKSEAYYQQLYNLAVSAEPGNTFCMVNSLDGFYDDTLKSTGKGKNYGIELTLEKFFSHQTYFLLTGSLSQSEYTAGNGKTYSTRFNIGRTLSLIAGKEWNVRNNRLGLNVKLMWLGGMHDNPIDIAASKAAGKTVRDYTKTYAWQNPDYVRMDTKIMYKINKRKHSVTWSLDLQNTTNHPNVWGSYYDAKTGKVAYSKQAPLIPILAYKIEF